MKKNQARFWHYHHGLVKIKIAAGQALYHSHGGPTDEGYHWESTRYYFDDDIVTCETHVDSRDCDGRYMHEYYSWCYASQLAAGAYEPAPDFDINGFCIRYPDWQHGPEKHRDFSAEAMNY